MFRYHSADRLLIIPPFFAFGIVISFLCPLWFVLLISCFCIFFIGIYRFLTPLFSVILWVCLPILIGIGIGKNYYFLSYEHILIDKIYKNLSITGKIIDIQDTADKPRIILKVNEYQNLKISKKIRLNVSHLDYQKLNHHDIITAKVFLAPPAKALFEGAYNFDFYAKLHGFGATGRVEKIIEHIRTSDMSLSADIHTIRLKIADIILKTLPLNTASPIVAMTTGARFYIPDTIAQAWKASGIYHLLSISGLHITIIAGICFVLVRHLLLFIPVLAYGGKVKKITAICTIPLTYGYVLLSGGDVPVIRAYIMVCVGLVALLFNQRMITLRSACIAFCLVLLINPIDIFNIGFALSFAAVLGIIIAVNFISFLKQHYSLSKVTHFMIVNMCAGYAGLPLAIYVFNSNALLGLFSNMVAVPISGTVMMPLMVLSIVLMPLGLHEYPLVITGFCIKILNILSLWIADFPYTILYQQSPLLIWIIIFYTSIYLLALGTKQSVKLGVIFVVCSVIGHSLSKTHDYLKLKTEKTIFYLDTRNNLVQLVRYDKKYFNPYTTEQVLLYFGRNPKSVYYYEKCDYQKTYITLSGFKFKCNS